MYIHCKVLQGGTAAISPFLHIGIIPLGYLPVIEYAIAELLPQDILEIPQYQLGVCEDLIQVGP